MSECCLKGSLHKGTPKGQDGTLGELDCYVTGKEQGTRAVVILTDVFGHTFVNSRLVADEFTDALNVPVYVPDYFNGYPMSQYLALIQEETQSGIFQKIWYAIRLAVNIPSFIVWWNYHKMDVTLPRIQRAIEMLRTKGYKNIVVQGYCFGGMSVILCSPHIEIEAFVATHPAGVALQNIEQIKQKCLLQMPDTDVQWSANMYKKTESILLAKGSLFHRYLNVDHGFAVRCNTEDQVAVAAKKEAIAEACKFLKQYL